MEENGEDARRITDGGAWSRVEGTSKNFKRAKKLLVT